MTDVRSSSPRPSDALARKSAGSDTTRAGSNGRKPRSRWAGRLPMSLRLGDPSGLFRLLDSIFGPLAFLRHLILPGLLLALGVMWFNWLEYLAHVDRIYVHLEFLQTLLITILTASLFGKITQGVVMHRHGAISDEWGIKMSMGVVPRFYISKVAIPRLSFPAQRASHAAPLQFRLVMFIVGMLVWDMTRRNGTSTSDVALVMAVVGLASFLFTANPLWPADGYHWLTARVERPKLRTNSLRVLRMVFQRQPLPATLKRREFWLLLGYAVVSIVFTAFIIFAVLSGIAYSLESSLGGTGMALFALMLASVSVFLLSKRERSQGRKSARRSRGRSEDEADEW